MTNVGRPFAPRSGAALLRLSVLVVGLFARNVAHADDDVAHADDDVAHADDDVAHVTGSAPRNEVTAEKVAIVVAGDPDDAIVARARDVADELTRSGVAMVHDPEIAAALRGEPGTADDGLASLRAARRSIALSGATAAERIGRATGARWLVVVRSGGSSVMHVMGTRVDTCNQDVPEGREAAILRTCMAREGRAAEQRNRSFFGRNWALIVAGGALAIFLGAVLLTRGGDNASPAMMLRFGAGGSP